MALAPARPGDDDAPMHERARRLIEGAGPDGSARRARTPEHPLLFLQRTAGNAAVSSLLVGTTIQRFKWPWEDEGEEEEPEEGPEEEPEEGPEEGPGDPAGGGGAYVFAYAVPGDSDARINPSIKLRDTDEEVKASEACAADPRITELVHAYALSLPYEPIPLDQDSGNGYLDLRILPVVGTAVITSDELGLIGRQALRYRHGGASPDIERIIYSKETPAPGGGPSPVPGGGPGVSPVGPGGGGAGPGGIPGMEPVTPGGGPGPGGIPGMEPVTPGGGPGPGGTRPMLRVGSTGDAVRQAQELLVRHGATLSPDGQFGPLTQRAVIDFQRSAGLTPDGIVGPRTWSALETG